MAPFGYLRRRRERESAVSTEQLATLNAAGTDAGLTIVEGAEDGTEEPVAAAVRELGRGPGLASALHDAFRYRKLAKSADPAEETANENLKDVQDAVMQVMKEHGIDPSSPDPSRLMDPEVQRALRDALLKAGHEHDG